MLWKIEHFWCWQVRTPVGEYLGQVSDDWALVTDRRPTCACALETGCRASALETGAAGPLPGLCCGVRTPVSWTRVRAQEMGWWNTLSGIWCLHSDHSPRPLGKGRELDHPRPARGGCWRLRRSDHRRDASVSCLPPARYGVLWGRIHHGPGEEHQGQHAKGRLDSLHLQGDPSGKPPWAPLSLHLLLVLSRVRSVAQSCPTLGDPMDRSTPGFPVLHQLPELVQAHDHRVGDAIRPPHPLSSPFSCCPRSSRHQLPLYRLFFAQQPRILCSQLASTVEATSWCLLWPVSKETRLLNSCVCVFFLNVIYFPEFILQFFKRKSEYRGGEIIS